MIEVMEYVSIDVSVIRILLSFLLMPNLMMHIFKLEPYNAAYSKNYNSFFSENTEFNGSYLWLFQR